MTYVDRRDRCGAPNAAKGSVDQGQGAAPSAARMPLLGAVTVLPALVVLEILLALLEPLYLTRLKNAFDRHGRRLLVRCDTEIATTSVRNIAAPPGATVSGQRREPPGSAQSVSLNIRLAVRSLPLCLATIVAVGVSSGMKWAWEK